MIDVFIAIDTSTVAVIPAVPPAIIAIYGRGRSAAVVTPVISPVSPGKSRRGLAAPRQVESIAFRSIVLVFDPNHGHSAVARIANQFLPAPSVNA
jgi:hypothetical protein